MVRVILLFSILFSFQHVFAATLINGAGATFPYPLYAKWFSEYQKVDPETHINYQPIGSGGGIRQFMEGTIDFGATDVLVSEKQKSKFPFLQIPMAMGAVVIVYNLTLGTHHLVLDSKVIADIFLGKIKKWNDPRILALNPNLSLPDSAILVIYRSDASGTSNIFTSYLSKTSPEWEQKIGKGTSVDWPVGLGGKGNEGVTALVKQMAGSISYSEFAFAKHNNIKMAETNGAPITAFTYLLVRKKMPDSKGLALLKFLRWAIGPGQKYCESLSYISLPRQDVTKVENLLKTIEVQ